MNPPANSKKRAKKPPLLKLLAYAIVGIALVAALFLGFQRVNEYLSLRTPPGASYRKFGVPKQQTPYRDVNKANPNQPDINDHLGWRSYDKNLTQQDVAEQKAAKERYERGVAEERRRRSLQRN